MFRIASVRRPLICTGRGKLLCIHRKSALHLFNKSKLIVWLVFFYVQRLYYRVQTGINFSLENVNPVHRKQSTTRLRKKNTISFQAVVKITIMPCSWVLLVSSALFDLNELRSAF